MTAGVERAAAGGLRRYSGGHGGVSRGGIVAAARRRLHDLVDRLISSASLVSNDPIVDVRDLPWTQGLRDAWQVIRDEAAAGGTRPATLWRDGAPLADVAARYPRTTAALAAVPGLAAAAFVALAPRTHVAERRGATKRLVTCHLGLVVPRDGDVRMRVRDRVVRWAEGETLVFDDTCPHEVWNDSRGTRLVLVARFERPLRAPAGWLAKLFRRLLPA